MQVGSLQIHIGSGAGLSSSAPKPEREMASAGDAAYRDAGAAAAAAAAADGSDVPVADSEHEEPSVHSVDGTTPAWLQDVLGTLAKTQEALVNKRGDLGDKARGRLLAGLKLEEFNGGRS